ncbi:alpha/beta hydrolase [Lysobacter koreensis]|uniref:Alpha/beta hydrolase n=1 Tax=Lysobacter koreensis TaxID=266122 RepID=A0ABW2YKV7_9GAMM
MPLPLLCRLWIAALLWLAGACAPAWANPQLATVPGARANMDVLQPFNVQSKDFTYPHQVTVALPASYAAQPERRYPVLWVPDAPLLMRTVVGLLDVLVIGNLAPEMIVEGVGSPAEEGLAGVGRRVMDFSPPGPGYAPPGLAGERWTALAPLPTFPHKADAFLGLLVDDLRPRLAAQYRFSGEHALLGHSAGGMLAAYSLFARPGAFQKMIIGSPYLEGVAGAAFKAEARYAASHDDLAATVFLGVGEREATEYFVAISGNLESTARLSRTLTARHYRSLALDTRVFAGKDHYTVLPDILISGIAHLWRDEIAKLPSSWPTREPAPPRRAGAATGKP